MSIFDHLSSEFVMGLYELKKRAEKSDDKSAIASLQQAYPELFTDDFSTLISQLEEVIEYFKLRTDITFSDLFTDKLGSMNDEFKIKLH